MIVQSADDRAAVGRRIVAMLAGTALVVGLVISRLDVSEPPVNEQPIITGGDRHRTVVRGDAFGECYVEGHLNGTRFRRLLLDSGAVGTLVLGSNQAALIGFDPAHLSYTETYSSATGEGRETEVRIRELRLVDGFVMRDVPARITLAEQSEPLIGIDILRRLNLRLKDGNCELSWG